MATECAGDFLMLAMVGIIGGIAQLFMTKAFRLGEAAVAIARRRLVPIR